MGKKTAAQIVEEKTGKVVGPYKHVRIASCAPNDWNPNKMTAAIREKLARGINAVLDAVGHIPPIIVRRHPDRSIAKYQIIDGFHRWDILREDGKEFIDAYIIDVDTKTAMILTDTLNYLRGEADPDLVATYYQRLLEEQQMPIEEAALFLPESADEIQMALDTYGIQIDKIAVPTDENVVEDPDAKERWIEVKFLMSASQAEIVEQEIARISKLIDGKNVRGRALEFMAVNSSQTPIDNLTGEKHEEKSDGKMRLKGLKKKLKEKAA